jgi:hypothetical protein
MTSSLEMLYDSLQHRLRPEDVAELVLAELRDDLSKHERRLLDKAAAGSLTRGMYKLTSMAQDFWRPVPPIRQARKADELFASAYPLSDADCADVDTVRALVHHISREIRKTPGPSDFKADRLSHAGRRQAGLDISRRRYNKLFRFLDRFERKIETYQREQRRYRATRIAKSGLAVDISAADFSTSRDAACFIAYFTARRNRRSVFTNQRQDRAFDEVSEALLHRFTRHPSAAGWRAIAHVMTDADVVRHLADEDKMELFGAWLAILRDIADLLREVWQKSHFDRATMIVRRGDDSSTWNALAGAWNEARRSWLSLLHALGMEEELETLCFGKAMRLMAADVAAWHRASGGALEPDTLVWAELPPPWDVFSGESTCTRADVERACRSHGVDPVAKGWTMPPAARRAVPFTPTPELVHGVSVSHPELATILRRAGWFSAKGTRPLPAEAGPVVVYRDPAGAALLAAPGKGDAAQIPADEPGGAHEPAR